MMEEVFTSAHLRITLFFLISVVAILLQNGGSSTDVVSSKTALAKIESCHEGKGHSALAGGAHEAA